ncbi:Uncharacterised protein [Mycobacteroides abscessus subsp. abscessus]|uniref:hypothetical protein n=1 Tax=Mycobacteroides abscessus TaxID=36809 RepID=UPI0009A63199|nr:hypothetical protein [Mycobacteroides abscessus]SLJ22897.1 Uncharacterised protein [Mycobacteroides abscessus subsp. abscessus]
MTSPDTARIVAAADTITTIYAAALRPLTEIAAETPENPPALDTAVDSVGWLITSGPHLDRAVNLLLGRLIHAGVTRDRIRRLLGVRPETLNARLGSAPDPAAPTAVSSRVGMFTDRDKVSVRAARESLITAAADLIGTYADALRPLSQLSEGAVPEAATVEAALEGVAVLHGSRRDLDAALDRVLACLVLGGVKRMSLAEVVEVAPSTLQKRLSTQPLARARGCDLVQLEDGTWGVQRAAVGRWAS